MRSALLGTTLGILGITAVLVFGASLDHLAATPRLYGWGWDTTVEPNGQFRPRASGTCGDVDTADRGRPGARGRRVDLPRSGRGRRPARDRLVLPITCGARSSPTIVTGRAPRADDEVALGKATLDAIGKDVGDTVRVRGETQTARFRVVGQVVLPHLSDEDTDPIAEGAVFTGDVIADLFEPITAPNMYFVARFADDVDPRRDSRALGDGAWRLESGSGRVPTRPVGDRPPLDRSTTCRSSSAASSRSSPSASVAHVVRGRGPPAPPRPRGAARASGSSARDVRATIAYQATILGVVGLVVGMPLGIVVGRVVWSAVADGVGRRHRDRRPGARARRHRARGALLVVNVIGGLGATAAIRDRPATVLATE